MARTLKLYRIDTITARRKLVAREKPYFGADLGNHRALGYIRREGLPGLWLVRQRKDDGRYSIRMLGEADDAGTADAVPYSVALERARGASFDGEERRAAAFTVADAAEAYLLDRRQRKSEASEKAERGRYEKHIKDKLGAVPVKSLTRKQVSDWHNGLLRKSDDAELVRRSKDTANRLLTTLKAILNHAARNDESLSDSAWRHVVGFPGVAQPRGEECNLTEKEMSKLISEGYKRNHDLGVLLEAMALTGARLSEMKVAKVRDWDGRLLTLTTKKGTGKPRTRHNHMQADARAFLDKLVAGRDPDDFLLGKDWSRANQYRLVKAAAKAAGLEEASITALRHSFGGRSIEAGAPLLHVAKHMGTSVKMLESTYVKLLDSHRQQVVEQTAPKLRIKRPRTSNRAAA